MNDYFFNKKRWNYSDHSFIRLFIQSMICGEITLNDDDNR